MRWLTAVSILIAQIAFAGPGLEQEVRELRDEINKIKEQHAKELQLLEERLKRAEQVLAQQQTVAPVPVPSMATPSRGNAFNPAIGVVLDAKLKSFAQDPATYRIPGFQLGGEAGIGEEGLTLGESEINLNANVDDWFFANLTLALASEDGDTEVELEEAYLQTLSLPAGLTLRGGRFFSATGYLNEFHPHAWDFADAPLTHRVFLARQYIDDGVQLRWIAPTDLFVEIGAELLRGATFPASGASHDGKGVSNFFTRLGGDISDSHSWRFGLSYLRADVSGRTDNSDSAVFDGDSDLLAADVVWKWAPGGNPKYRNFKFVAEYFRRKENGTITANSASSTLQGKQNGWYAQAVYQFMPQWRFGLRYDRLGSDNTGNDLMVLDDAGLLDEGHTPWRLSIMLDYSRSELSRLRLQYNRDESAPRADNQWMLQYIMSFGAHGGHQF